MRIPVRASVVFTQNGIDLLRRTVRCLLIRVDEPNLNKLIMRKLAIKSAFDFWMANSQSVGLMHTDLADTNRVFPVRLWEDWDGSGWVELYIGDDAAWERVTNGEYTGASWAGYAEVQDLGDGYLECAAAAEMWECSLVDVPAEPLAVWNSAEGGNEGDSLTAKLSGGKLKPRITRQNAARLGSRQNPLFAMVANAAAPLLELLNNANFNPASGGESNLQEIDMTPEQVKAMFGELITPLTERIEQLTEQMNSLAAKSEDEKPTDTASAEPLTADAIANALKPLIEAAVQPVAQAQADQGKKLEELSNAPATSKRFSSDNQAPARQHSWKK